MVSDEILLTFFRQCRKALVEVDCKEALRNETWTTAECRRFILDKQRHVLSSTLSTYNQKSTDNSRVSTEEVQERLTNIKKEALSRQLEAAMTENDASARQALCKLILYSETHRETPNQDLQNDGRLNRSKLLEYLGLCQSAITLECVEQNLRDNTPLFDDLQAPKDEPTAMAYPQKRLEKVQQILAKAVGLEPRFVTSELTRIFVDPATAATCEYSDDQECRDVFRRLIVQMQTTVANASLHSDPTTLSDRDKGGVTRVVAVQYSEVGDGSSSDAPKKNTMELPQEEQIRQIRVVSEAKKLQEELLKELEDLSPEDRKQKLKYARQVSDVFLQSVIKLPPGPERIRFLQTVDPEKSKLLTMYKLWVSMHGEDDL
ncbi:unnamed protein product [Cylindrotheca closterium]|uniref:Uncharacterized protein n=1 Tax=Cylindrotheca closterium TaxID=2856 RepID=A0AAD2JHZ8_9STRA|nr:unnamed protein product [Cylindrotheca closterium]